MSTNHEKHASPSASLQMRRKALVQRFDGPSKTSLQVFQRLSQHVEKLMERVRGQYGQRSGQLGIAFGAYADIKSRFSAKNGIPPKTIYRTAGGWIRVLEGLARVLRRDPDAVVVEALEFAFTSEEDWRGVDAEDVLQEFYRLLGLMRERLAGCTSTLAMADYVARSGLDRDGGALSVGEAPDEEIGFREGPHYHGRRLELAASVFGLNCVAISDEDIALEQLRGSPAWHLPFDFAENLDGGSSIRVLEARLVGLGWLVNTETLQPDLALIEWDRSVAKVSGQAHQPAKVYELIPQSTALAQDEERFVASAGFTGLSDAYSKPIDWHPNRFRCFFPRSAGFERLAKSTLARPWVWHDLNPDLWMPDWMNFDDLAVPSPAHTVAAAIEGNLLYADAAGQAEQRLDRLLISRSQQLEGEITAFRERAASTWRVHRDALFAEWGKGDNITND